MARLRDLGIELSPSEQEPPNETFRWTAHHVRQLVMRELPSSFSLDGSGRVTLVFGSRGDNEQYSQFSSTSEFFVEDFDLPEYWAASGKAREELLLQAVAAALNDIASRVRADPQPVLEAANRVRASGFSACDDIKKLSRRLRGTNVRAVVERRLSQEVGELWSVKFFAGDQQVGLKNLDDSPCYLDRQDYYKNSSWDGAEFVIHSRLGKEVFRSAPVAGTENTPTNKRSG